MSVSERPAPFGGLNAAAEERRAALEALAGDLGAIEQQLAALSDPDWRVRKQASIGLCAQPLRGPVLRKLVAMLGPGPSVAARNAAVGVLGSQGLPAIRLLDEALSTLDVDTKKLAAEAMALSGEVAALQSLRRLLEDADLNVRVAAIEAIAEVGSSEKATAGAVLEPHLGTGDPYLTICVLQAMDRLGVAPSWRSLEVLLELPLLLEPALRIAARLGVEAAAPHYVAAMERSRGNTWEAVVGGFADYARGGDVPLRACGAALAGLSSATTERLFAGVAEGNSPLAGASLVLLCVQGTSRAYRLALSSVSNDELAADALAALKLSGGALAPVLFEVLAEDSELVLVDAVELLTYLMERGELASSSIAELRALAQHDSPSVVRAWLRAVALFGDEQDAELAARFVSDAQPRAVRRAAVEAIRECARRWPLAVKQRALDVSPKAERAAIVALAMSALQEPVFPTSALDHAFLMGAASSEYVCVRCAVMSALGNQRSSEAGDALRFALSDEDHEVRMAAIAGLGELQDAAGQPLGAEHLLEFAKTTLDAELGLAAFHALPVAAHGTCVGSLMDVLEAVDGWRAVAAAETLARFRHDASTLVEPLASEARYALAQRLGHEQDPDVVSELRRSYTELGPGDLGGSFDELAGEDIVR